MNGPCPKKEVGGAKADLHRSAFGFTMLELLVALAILVAAFSIIWSTFFSTVRAWERGGELLDQLHNGDFVLEQLVLSLRSAAFFGNLPGAYGFRMEDRGGRYPRDEISWVTSGTSFLPADSPLANGLYRIHVTIEDNDEGEAAVAVRAFPHLAESGEDDVDPWYVSTRVKGLDCRTYNFEEEYWEDAWEDTNALPSLVEITLFTDPIEEYGDPVILQRLVEIPVAPAVSAAVVAAEGRVNEEGGTEKQPAGATPAPAQPQPTTGNE